MGHIARFLCALLAPTDRDLWCVRIYWGKGFWGEGGFPLGKQGRHQARIEGLDAFHDGELNFVLPAVSTPFLSFPSRTNFPSHSTPLPFGPCAFVFTYSVGLISGPRI